MKILNIDNCIIEKEVLETPEGLMLKGYVELERQSSNNVFVPIKLIFDPVFLNNIKNTISGESNGFDITGVFHKNSNAELVMYNPHITKAYNRLNTGSIIVHIDILLKDTISQHKTVVGQSLDQEKEIVYVMGNEDLFKEYQELNSGIIKTIGEYLHTPENIYTKSIYHEVILVNTRLDKSNDNEDVFDIYPENLELSNQQIPWVDSIIL